MSFSKTMQKTIQAVCLGFMFSLVQGCVSSDTSDLKGFIEDVKSRKGGRIDPLPEIKPYKTYLYQAQDMRGPFSLGGNTSFQTDLANRKGSATGLRPDAFRRKEPLEDYPLDTLGLVGMIEKEDKEWGLIQTQDGTIHKVQVGHYMGLNHGKITSISEESVSLIELIQDSEGGWIERDAAVALEDE